MNAKQLSTLGLLALIWGSSFLLIKVSVVEMGPVLVVAGRLALGLLFLFGALLVRGQRLPGRQLWKALLVVALVNNVAPFLLIAWGEQQVASGLAAVLNSTTPLFSVILASTWGDETLSASKISGLLLGFLGVVALIGMDVRDFFVASSTVAAGQFAIVLASASYAVGAVYARRWLRGQPALQLASGQLLIAFVIVLPFALLPSNMPAQLPSIQALLAVAALGLFGSGLAYLLFYSLLEQVGATRTVVVTYLLPVVAVLLGWVVLGERLSWQTMLGLGLILMGVALVNEMRVRPRRPVPALGVQEP
jgi:drug/metabolite transporter (DMT)-like permease